MDKKTIIITGASRGIGRACALSFAAGGWNVVINYFSSAEKAHELLKSIEQAGGSGIAINADVSSPEQVKRLFSQAKERFGRIDAVINNAGIAQKKLFIDITQEDWRNMLDVNLGGVFYCCQQAVEHMMWNRRGCIINISSIWGMAGGACEAHYSAAKAGIIGLTKALAKEAGQWNIRINCIAPGVIDTDMNAGLSREDINEITAQTPLGRTGSPRDIAALALFLASEDAQFITGQIISPNGGLII